MNINRMDEKASDSMPFSSAGTLMCLFQVELSDEGKHFKESP